MNTTDKDKLSTNKENIDQVISDLIIQRKLQQEALSKIKASVEKRQPHNPTPGSGASVKKEKRSKPKL